RSSWRANWSAERPGVCVVTRYAAQNHNPSGILDRCMTVPAVTDAWWWHALHSKSRREDFHHASVLSQREHTKPSSQREAIRYSRQASSVANRFWKSRGPCVESRGAASATSRTLPLAVMGDNPIRRKLHSHYAIKLVRDFCPSRAHCANDAARSIRVEPRDKSRAARSQNRLR